MASTNNGEDPREIAARQEHEKKVTKDLDAVREELRDFSEAHGVRDMNSRWRRGMNSAAILGIERTRKVVQEMVKAMHGEEAKVVYKSLLEMTVEIQKNGPWKYADKLREANDPAVKLWYMLEHASVSSREQATERKLTREEFLAELTAVQKALKEAVEDTATAGETVVETVRSEARKRLRVEDGIPITESSHGFIDMAIEGYSAGIFQDADGMLYVGAKEIPEGLFEAWGLSQLVELKPSKTIETYLASNGDSLIQKIGTGFVIIRSRSFDLAKAIVRACNSEDPKSVTPPEGSLGHVTYEPTSVVKGRELAAEVQPDSGPKSQDDDRAKKSFLRRKNDTLLPAQQETTAMVRAIDEFYSGLEYIRSMHVALDALSNKRLEKASKGKPFTPEDFDKEVKKVAKKQRQKVDELRYLNKVFEDYIDKLPEGVNRFIDMAGGSGDLGLALSTLMLSRGKELKETIIADPFSSSAGLDYFMDTMLDYLPFKDELREKVVHTNEYVQEVDLPEDSVVVAKHSCGTLTDSIIDRWCDSKSPILMIMTCCHNKAIGESARYGMSQKEWDTLCKETGKATNQDNPKVREAGMAALTKLDNARIAYLKRRGFDAVLTQTDEFPMGDVIIVQRKAGSKHK